MKKTVMSFMAKESAWHSGKKGCTMYSERVMQMMDSIAGFKMNTEIHEKRKASRPPKDSRMYEYSAPDFVISVPSSA